jgi:hypothetical protein
VDAQQYNRETLSRLPLAEAALLLLDQALPPEACLDLFDRLKGRCYQRQLPFDTFVGLIRDALVRHRGSARPAFAAARQRGALPVSDACAYDKLARVPLPLSEALVAESSQRLLPLLPGGLPSPLPQSLRRFRVEVLDGKVAKRVAKRLKALRGLAGGALGGKGLASLNRDTGLVTALAGSPDGDANDASLVPALVERVRGLAGPDEVLLWLGDAQFADLTQTHRFKGPDGRGHFLLRYSRSTKFVPDPQAGQGRDHPGLLGGVDERGRRWRQEWGWLGAEGNRKRLYVRRITLERPGEEAVAVITDLLDPLEFPAEDLLLCYLGRGTIEGVFQKVVEVFALGKLISSSPRGTVFQLGFCLVLYNVVAVACAHLAAGQGLAAAEVSSEMVFDDLRKDLEALLRVVKEDGGVAGLLPAEPTPAQVRARLAELLGGLWRPIWRKATNKRRRPHPAKPRDRAHCSVHRVLLQHKRQKLSLSNSNSP